MFIIKTANGVLYIEDNHFGVSKFKNPEKMESRKNEIQKILQFAQTLYEKGKMLSLYFKNRILKMPATAVPNLGSIL